MPAIVIALALLATLAGCEVQPGRVNDLSVGSPEGGATTHRVDSQRPGRPSSLYGW